MTGAHTIPYDRAPRDEEVAALVAVAAKSCDCPDSASVPDLCEACEARRILNSLIELAGELKG